MARDLDMSKTVTTDEQGAFSIELNQGVYDVFVSAVGFDPQCRTIEVESGKKAVYNIKLTISRVGNEE
jgi:hypothetical protein